MKEYDPNTIPLWIRGNNDEMIVPRTPVNEEELKPWKKTNIVGTSPIRVDAYERVSGSAQYTYDVYLPGMLHCAVLRSPHAHARIKSINVDKAKQMPGVRAVICHKDKEAQIGMFGDRTTLFDTHLRFHGDEVAAVAAETIFQAEAALKEIEVEYEELDALITEEEATAKDAPVILENENQDRGRTVGPNNTVKGGGGNNRGDVEKGFQEADAVVEMEFHMDCVIHTPLEVHGTVSMWEGNSLKMWDSTQGVFSILHGIYGKLGIAVKDTEVIGDYVGGGFGAKLSPWKHQFITAVLAKMTARPVKYMHKRTENFIAAGNRPLTDGKLKAGAKKDGTITAIQHIGSSTGGAFPYTNTTGFQSGELYLVENFKQDEHFYLNNTAMGCAMRAPGFPNGNFMTEQIIDQLAHDIDMDPVQFRAKNVPTFSQLDSQNRPYTSTGLKECLLDGAKAFKWEEKRARKNDEESPVKRGAGVAGGMWAYGGGWPPATIILKMYMDGSVSIITGASDIGTGTKTILTMIVAEELDMPVDRVRIDNADTGHTPYASASGGSKTLPTEGPAARNAAWELRKKLFSIAAEKLGVAEDDLEMKQEKISSKSSPDKAIETSALLRETQHFDVVGVGYRSPNPEDKIIRTFGAHFADVEVNVHTGKVVLKSLVAANESGRVINRKTFDNQVIGGMTMAVGQGMTEQRIMDQGQTGKMVNRSWLDYKVPTSMEVPFEQEVVAIEPEDNECNNLGAKGLGEPAMIPTMAAIANAIYNAIGVRITRTPITPVEVMKALAEKESRG